MTWLGIDIGGANLKAADGLGWAASLPFALWREPKRLAEQLRTLMAHHSSCDHVAATMTGELADCFENKATGVAFILDAVEQAADGRDTLIYLHDGSLVAPDRAKAQPASVAAANWHALARFAARFTACQPALLIDVGSTTCDVIPLLDGEVATLHRTDTARLLSGELVYAGIERTPVCALVSKLPYRGQSCPIAREFFATTADVYTVLDRVPEQPLNRDTADGRPATKAAARGRLARMVCSDSQDFDECDAAVAAETVADAFAGAIEDSVRQVTSAYALEPQLVILSGHGAFAGQMALERAGLPWQQLSLASQIGETASRCAPAHALAVLAREAVGG